MSQANPTQDEALAPRKRKRGMLFLLIVFVIAGIAYAVYWFLHSRFIETTDDAYVAGHIVQVTPQVGGTVQAVHVEDTDVVPAGAPLIDIDRADAKVALDQAEAALAESVRQVRTLYANNGTYEAQIRVRQAEVERYKQDIARRQAIASTGAVALEEIDHAKDALRGAEAALAAAREQLASNRVLTEGTQVEKYPTVQRASAKLEETWLAWSRSHVVAPVAGQIARRNVQVGQRIAPGTPLMAVVPLDRVWVDANFKEGQLHSMRVGQPVSLVSDIYGSKVTYHGKVAGLGAGTGAAFALLPAQNATGNWIKVVQRVPVRITLDPKELNEHPLRIGLSMNVEIDTRNQGGAPVGQVKVSDTSGLGDTDVVLEQARTRARDIIRQNINRP
ncbi:MAG: HlyD family efflux transporter periplasmic adaptor subunit [Rhodocyclaceae bacterium]